MKTETPAALTFTLTREDAQEVAHKLTVLSENPDGQEGYNITQDQADALARSVLVNTGGEWSVPAWALAAVRGEMADHVIVMRDIAADARAGREDGQALRISKQAKRLEKIFAL